MSALAGLWSFDDRPTDGAVSRMLQAQALFGQKSGTTTLGSVTLGRRQFKLFPEDDPDPNPVAGGADAFIVAADVRLDNRAELAELLSVPSARLPYVSDTQLVSLAFQLWQEKAFSNLVGDFAVAIWDSRNQRLLLARDFLGNRPLHYYRNRDFFALASMPVGLHALPDVPRLPNEQAVADFLALAPETGRRTFFQDVDKVEPGHFAVVTREAFRSQPYWTPPTDELRLKTRAEYEEALRVEFDRAVSARLRGMQGRVATHLSGGLDSSTVTASAARLLGEPAVVTAYTAVPREGYVGGIKNAISDEGTLAAELVRLYSNIEHVKVAAGGASPLDALDRSYQLFGRPLPNLSNQVWSQAILADARDRGITVLLTGELGNISFSYDGMAALPMMARGGRLIDSLINASAVFRNGSRFGTVAAQLLGPFLPSYLWRTIQRARGRNRDLLDLSVINPCFSREAFAQRFDGGTGLSAQPSPDPRGVRLDAMRRIDRGNYHKGALGGWGVDIRDPTSDRRLVELCLRIPPEQYLGGGIPRSLARTAFRDRLPASIMGERRKGYQAADWHEALTTARPQLRAELGRLSAVDMANELLDIERMKEFLTNWPSQGWHTEKVFTKYRLALLRGISAGHFIRKSTGSNA